MSSNRTILHSRVFALLLTLVASIACASMASVARAEEPDKSVTAGQEALKRSGNHPWYDKEADGVRVLPLRADQEEETDEAPKLPIDGAAPVGLGFFQVSAWITIGLILSALIGLLIRTYLERENSTAEPQKAHTAPSVSVDRVEALPFQVQRAQDDLLGEARRLYDQGNFREAIIYLFSFELVQLDRHGVIRLAKGKTNRQYVREASRQKRPVALLLEQTMEAFEWAFFGHHDLPRERFESCWHRVSEFERLAAEGT